MRSHGHISTMTSMYSTEVPMIQLCGSTNVEHAIINKLPHCEAHDII